MNEQLRLLNESSDVLRAQELEISHLAELIDDQLLDERLSIIDRQTAEGHHRDNR